MGMDQDSARRNFRDLAKFKGLTTKPEDCFATEEGAKAAGYRKAAR